MKYYLNPWFITLFMWSLWLSAPQCTRCGGQHSLSRCPWPAAEQERSAS